MLREIVEAVSYGNVKQKHGAYIFHFDGDTITMVDKAGKVMGTKKYPSLTSVQTKAMAKEFGGK